MEALFSLKEIRSIHMSFVRFILLLILPLSLGAAELSGTVTSPHGDPLAKVTLTLAGLNRQTTTNLQGHYQFTDVPEGSYQITAYFAAFSSYDTKTIMLDAESTIQVDFTLDFELHSQLVVSASAREKPLAEMKSAVSVLGGEELTLQASATLGETLGALTGVSETGFAPGASRPIIRGLEGDRLRLLQGGMDQGDVSAIGPDHAVVIEPLLADQIEVLRGPAALRYGGQAIGGVVNVLDQRLPFILPDQPLTGDAQLLWGSDGQEKTITARTLATKGNLVFSAQGLARDRGDMTLPGGWVVEEDHDHEGEDHDHEETHTPESDTLDNSAVRHERIGAGLSWVTPQRQMGLSITRNEQRYGVPFHEHHDHEDAHEASSEEEEEEAIAIELEDLRLDFKGRWALNAPRWEAIETQVTWVDYQHQEIEGALTGTRFENQTAEWRTEALHHQWGWLTQGSLGAHVLFRDFSANGEEAYVPPNESTQAGIFAFEEKKWQHWHLEAGVRVETVERSVTGALPEHHHEEEEEHEEEEAMASQRDFSLWSTSLALAYSKEEGRSVAINLSMNERAPTPEELFAHGFHTATQRVEIGSSAFEKEKSVHLEGVIRWRGEGWHGDASLYHSEFDGFITPLPTGELEDGFEVLQYAQQDATFHGWEAHVDVDLIHRRAHHLTLGVTGDQVWAETDANENLPRIPPRKWRTKLNYHHHLWGATLEWLSVERQNDLATGETPTAGYDLLHASVHTRWFIGQSVATLMVRGRNLNDALAFNHLNWRKDELPLPGRRFDVLLKFQF
jgi:iron complex outermembrane receptor protein